MALAIATIADGISHLVVAGLVIKDVNEIPAVGDVRQPLLIPLVNFVTDFTVERNSFGAAEAKMTVRYTLNYRLLYKPVGDGRVNTLEVFDDMVAMFGAIWDALLDTATITGSVDHEGLNGVVNMGVVEAPDGTAFWGCDIPIAMMEFVN